MKSLRCNRQILCNLFSIFNTQDGHYDQKTAKLIHDPHNQLPTGLARAWAFWASAFTIARYRRHIVRSEWPRMYWSEKISPLLRMYSIAKVGRNLWAWTPDIPALLPSWVNNRESPVVVSPNTGRSFAGLYSVINCQSQRFVYLPKGISRGRDFLPVW